MRILYVQTIRMDTHLCRTSRLEMIRELAALGHDVTFIAGYEHARPAIGDGIRMAWVRVVQVPYLSQLLFTLLVQVRLLGLLVTRPVDVVMLDPYTVHCTFPFDVLARVGLVKTRMVLDVRSGIFHVRHRRVGNWLLRVWRRFAFGYARALFAGFTTISPRLRDTLVKGYGLRAEKIGIWQSGVRPAALGAPAGPVAGLSDDRFVVMYHGTFGVDRGLEQAIAAMRRVRATNPGVVLLLLGNGTEEPRLRRVAAGLENVMFRDAVPHEQVAAFLHRCDVGIMPFLPTEVMRSSSPLKLMEYLAAGKPVVVSRIEAFTEVLGDAPGAIYLETQTPEAIAEAIRFAVTNRAALPRWGESGRAIVQRQFTWDKQAAALQGFLEALV